jgi:hypothetical protein
MCARGVDTAALVKLATLPFLRFAALSLEPQSEIFWDDVLPRLLLACNISSAPGCAQGEVASMHRDENFPLSCIAVFSSPCDLQFRVSLVVRQKHLPSKVKKKTLKVEVGRSCSRFRKNPGRKVRLPAAVRTAHHSALSVVQAAAAVSERYMRVISHRP